MTLLPRVSPVVKGWPLAKQLGIGVPVALLLWLMGSMVLALRHPGEIVVALEETAMGAGLLLGCAIAFPLEEAFVDYRPELMSMKKRAVAAVIGIPITLLVYVAMAEVSDILLPAQAADMLTYSVLIVVLTLLVPLVLKRYVVGGGSASEGNGN